MGLTRDRVANDEQVVEQFKNKGLSCEPPPFKQERFNNAVENYFLLQTLPISSDNVNHPPHYKNGPKCECGRTIECIDVTRNYSFNLGNAIKYIWRCDLKNINIKNDIEKSLQAIEDLEKSIWYLKDEIKQRSK